MSVLIGEKKGTILKYHQITVKSDEGKQRNPFVPNYDPKANAVHEFLFCISFLTYQTSDKCFIVQESALEKLQTI